MAQPTLAACQADAPQQELWDFLRAIKQTYVGYADQLHRASYESITELAAATPEQLVQHAQLPIGPAGAIVKAAAAAAAAAGAAGAECAFMHIVEGGKGKPPIKMAAGTVDLDAVERERGIEIQSVAVEDAVTRQPAWRAITSLLDMSLTLEPGKHLYIKCKKPGARRVGTLMLRLMVSTTWHWLVANMSGPPSAAFWAMFDFGAWVRRAWRRQQQQRVASLAESGSL